jgi:hypothetical protein
MPDGMPDRRSLTVRKIGTELNRAVEIRKALAEHADDPALILDTIEGETDLAEACCVVLEEIHEDEALLEGLKAKLAELSTRKGRMEKSIETRRNLILMAMERAGVPTIRSPLGTLSVKPTPAQARITDEAEIPARFWKPQDPKLDKSELASCLRSGEIIPGATLGNGGITLSIRTK